MPIDRLGREINQDIFDRLRQPGIDPEIVLAALTTESAVTFTKASHIDNVLGRTSCKAAAMWVMGGRNSTDKDGKCVINLNQLLCLKHDDKQGSGLFPLITNEPWFVASPVHSKPVILTTSYSMVVVNPGYLSMDEPGGLPTPYEAKITVQSWQLNSSAAPNIPFSWHCIVEGVRGFFPAG